MDGNGKRRKSDPFLPVAQCNAREELEPAGVGDRKPGKGLHGGRVCAIHVSHRGVPPPIGGDIYVRD